MHLQVLCHNRAQSHTTQPLQENGHRHTYNIPIEDKTK